jgi:hypothetical protein
MKEPAHHLLDWYQGFEVARDENLPPGRWRRGKARAIVHGGMLLGWLDLYLENGTQAHVHYIASVSQGSKKGTRLMRLLCDQADMHGVTLTLMVEDSSLLKGPRPTDEKEARAYDKAKRLTRWYREDFDFGAIDRKGEPRLGAKMYRYSKSA